MSRTKAHPMDKRLRVPEPDGLSRAEAEQLLQLSALVPAAALALGDTFADLARAAGRALDAMARSLSRPTQDDYTLAGDE